MGLLDILRLRDGKREPTRPKLVELRSAKWFIMFTVSFAASTVCVSVPSSHKSGTDLFAGYLYVWFGTVSEIDESFLYANVK